MRSSTPQYDVAISFLSKDEPIGAAITGRLSAGLKVFFYPRNQEELAGTDGLESMRTPFLNDARVVVVLYRQPWGKTPWTGVEQIAIQEGCLNSGWQRLFFIVLDKTSAIPIWVPQNHVRFNYESFGLEQAVGAIKARVQECGGVIEPMTAIRRAALYEAEACYAEDRKQISSFEGMRIVQGKVLEVISEIKRLCDQITEAGNAQITLGANAGRCVLRNDRISLAIGWRQPYSNSTDGCGFKVVEFNAPTPLPNSGEMSIREPTQLTAALADRCVIEFLNLAARADQGEITPPRW
jgi:hypothetical protein